MFRIYEVRQGERRLVGGTPSLVTAQTFVMRLAGSPMLRGAEMGSYRGPNEFLPRSVGGIRFEIVDVGPVRMRRPAAA